jgi:DNA-binding CsgD family transcriptional regulator
MRAGPAACVIARIHTQGARMVLDKHEADSLATIDCDGATAPELHVATRAAPAGGCAGPLASLVDALAIGVLVVDGAGRAIYLNRRAAAIVARGDGVRLDREQRPVAAQTEARLRLAGLIEAVTDAPDGSGVGGCVRLPRRGGGGYTALAAPGGLVLLHDPDETIAAPPAMLRAIFGLTAREAELVEALASGMRVADFARRTGTSRNTTKFHLRSIYLKTGTNTQAGLVAAVAAAVAGLGGGAFAALWRNSDARARPGIGGAKAPS